MRQTLPVTSDSALPRKHPAKAGYSRFNLERRREIAEAALHILESEGYARLSARKVAARAGLSLGHITYNFAGMDEVLSEAYRLASDRLREATDATVGAASDTPQEKLAAFLRAGFTAEFLDLSHLRMRIDLWSAACALPALAATERGLYDHYRDRLETLLQLLAPAGAQDRIPALTDTLMALLDGLWLDWMRRQNRAAIDNGLAMALTLVHASLGNPD